MRQQKKETWWGLKSTRKLEKGQKCLKSSRIEWERARDIKTRVDDLSTSLDLRWIKKNRVVCFRSSGANTRATARIWGLARIWQMALSEKPKYIIEVIGERFDKLSEKEKDKVLIHELAHIPKTFSGALLPHRKGRGGFYSKLRLMIKNYENNSHSR